MKSKWIPSKINQTIEMTRCDFIKNYVEIRSLKWWEKIVYFRYIYKNTKKKYMKNSYECDCGVCSICNGIKKPVPPQTPGTKKWQHEETGRLVDMPIGKNPGDRWYPIADA